MDWLQKILSNAVYGEDGKLDVTATMKKINEEAPKHIIPKEQYNGKVNKLKEEHAAEIKGMRIDSAISKLLTENHAKYPELLSGKFDRDKLQVTEDGKVIGLDEQLKGITETYKDMFSSTVLGRTPSNPDGGKPENAFETLVNNADNMTAEEVAAQFEALAKQ